MQRPAPAPRTPRRGRHATAPDRPHHRAPTRPPRPGLAPQPPGAIRRGPDRPQAPVRARHAHRGAGRPLRPDAQPISSDGCRNRKPPSSSVPRPDATAAVQSSTSSRAPEEHVGRATQLGELAIFERSQQQQRPHVRRRARRASSQTSPRGEPSAAAAPRLLQIEIDRGGRKLDQGKRIACRLQEDALVQNSSEGRPHAIRGACAMPGRPARRRQERRGRHRRDHSQLRHGPRREGSQAPSRVAAQRMRAPRLKIGRANAHPRRRAAGVSPARAR